MMRSWGNRADTFVVDEPFYAHYLHATGAAHPAADEVIAAGETDWQKVIERLTTGAEPGRRIFYQKQMTHHLLPHISREWLRLVTNCFLIRDPAEVIASYLKKNDEPALTDLGLPQQAEIFDWIRTETAQTPPVIDARDVLEQPEQTLRLLCEAVGVELSREMLSWPAGLRDTDGVWAKHWYDEVANSTSFRKPAARGVEVPPRLRDVHEQARAIYDRLYRHRLAP
jgi:hypothetical protein